MYETLPLDEDKIGEDSNTPEKVFLEDEERRVVNEVVRSLPQPDQDIFIRRYFYFERVIDIARYLGMNEQTVGTKLYRGKEKLEKLFRERGIWG